MDKQNTAGCQAASVIVDDQREQVRSCMGRVKRYSLSLMGNT